MITPQVHALDLGQFDLWLESAPNGQWCSYDPTRLTESSPLMRRVRKAYEDRLVLMFQQRRAGRAEYLVVRVSRDTWAKVDGLAIRASDVFGARMKGRLEQFLAGQGVAA